MDREKEKPAGCLTHILAVVMRGGREGGEEVYVENTWGEVIK